MKNEFDYVGWLGEEDYLYCIWVAREAFFQAPRRQNFVQMAAAPMRMRKVFLSPQPKTADACKKGRLNLYTTKFNSSGTLSNSG